jgi:hypothetical protein
VDGAAACLRVHAQLAEQALAIAEAAYGHNHHRQRLLCAGQAGAGLFGSRCY